MSSPMNLGYWKIRGLAGPIRLLLTYTGTPFEETIYEQGDKETGFCRKQWTDVKETLGLPLANLPYLVDGNVKVTQSTAILRYIARKNKLLGSTPEAEYKADMIVAEAMDMNGRFLAVAYWGSPYEEKKAELIAGTPYYMQRLEDWIGDDPWFAGAELTYADFAMWHQLDQYQLMEPSVLSNFPKLAAFLKRFEELPELKNYIHGGKFIYWPINNKRAQFGGRGAIGDTFINED